jgi:hypothetical protein
MGFTPQLQAEDFRTFWSAGSGWGSYFQKTGAEKSWKTGVSVLSGSLNLKELSLQVPPEFLGKRIVSAKATLDGKAFKLQFANDGRMLVGRSRNPIRLSAGQELSVEAEF